MCLILEIPHNADPLSTDEFIDVTRSNPDGLCVLARDGTLLFRGLDPVAGMRHVVGQRDVIVHWRKATHGAIDEDRVHGWQVGSARLLHNGILPGAWGDKTRSDTYHLVEALSDVAADLGDPDWDPLLRALAGRSTVVIVGRSTGPAWLTPPAEVWRGRRYSNTYAWSGVAHGKPPPPPPPLKALQEVAGWWWDESGALITSGSRRGRRGR